MRIEQKIFPKKLYIRKNQKLNAIREVQKTFNEQLKEDTSTGIKPILITKGKTF
jgi:hypothetical protein